MKQLLHTLQLDASEGRHIFEYESLSLDWWDKESPINYEIELIFGDELHIFLFYFVPDTEGIVERAMILVAEYDANSGDLSHSLIADELKEEFYPTSSFPYDEEQGGYQLEKAEQVEQTMQQFIQQLANKNPIAHSALPEADHDENNTIMEYNPGVFLPHFISMYFMNNKQLNEESLEGFIQLAVNMEGVSYLDGLQKDSTYIYSDDAKELKQDVLKEHQSEAFTEATLKLFTQAILTYQVSSKE